MIPLIVESIINTYENRRAFIPFVIFISVSFLGIIITDSLIFSSTVAAQDELKINGDDTLTIYFDEPQDKDKIFNIFNHQIEVTAEKYAYIKIGETPFKANVRAIHGIEKIENIILSDDHNEIIVKDSLFPDDVNEVYLNGLPFKIIKKIEKKRTDFLDSLGLNSNNNTASLFIPLKTLSRLTLSNKINAINLRFDEKISERHLEDVKNILISYNITNYNMHSYMDAKKAVDAVIDRFYVLTNTIYILLFLTSCILTISLCKKNFHYRCTEFAIKIIHGVSPKQIAQITFTETIILIMISVIASCFISWLVLYQLSNFVGVAINIRLKLLILTSIMIAMVAIIANIMLGVFLYKRNPLNIIRDRFK
ncbi:permease [Escherichia coli]|uniref:FtsX-like permease family protein n=1 Tax=Escherichia coli TaxID=562 RepID=UPI00191B4D2B|nr:FtsX-like permease family protein [Escherichia coli]CAD6176069.1 permease [Escherichia coli]